MTNNKLCDIIGTVGCIITFFSLAGIFFGASWWVAVGIGITLILLSMWEYDD